MHAIPSFLVPPHAIGKYAAGRARQALRTPPYNPCVGLGTGVGQAWAPHRAALSHQRIRRLEPPDKRVDNILRRAAVAAAGAAKMTDYDWIGQAALRAALTELRRTRTFGYYMYSCTACCGVGR